MLSFLLAPGSLVDVHVRGDTEVEGQSSHVERLVSGCGYYVH